MQLELIKNRETKTGFSSSDEIKQLDKLLKISTFRHDTPFDPSSQRLTYTLDIKCVAYDLALNNYSIPQIILIFNWDGINQLFQMFPKEKIQRI